MNRKTPRKTQYKNYLDEFKLRNHNILENISKLIKLANDEK